MSLKAAASVLVIFLLSLPVVRGDITPDAPKTPTVSQSPTGEVMEGSQVTLTCSSDANPAANYTWYKVNYGQPLTKGAQLFFRSIQSSDSGQYYCEAENELGKRRSQIISIKVKYAPKSCSVSVSPNGEITEGSPVTLTCSCDGYPAPEYTWYKENDHGHHSKGSELVFSQIQSSDSGRYYCAAKNDVGRERTSGYTNINVKYAPKLHPVSVSPSGPIVEGMFVTLTCSSDANPAVVTYTWYKENGNKGLQTDSRSRKYFRSIRSSDSGYYYCTAENRLGSKTSESVFIDVTYAPKMISVSVSPSGEIVEGSSVTLTCSSEANPAASYTWYKKNRNTDLQLSKKGPKLVFSSIQAFDLGQYYCTAVNKLGRRTSEYITVNVKYAPKLPSVSVSPSAEIVEGSSVTLTCSSDANPAANYTWYKNTGNKDPHLSSNGPQLVFSSIQCSDFGQYYCTAENKLGRSTSKLITVDLNYAPKLPSVSVSPSAEVEEGRYVILTCSSDANPAANYTWYKENEDSPKAVGPVFTITDLRAEHSGNYSCEAQNSRGRHNSTLLLIVVTGNSTFKMYIIKLTLMLLMMTPLPLLALWMRKKKTLSSTTKPNERVEMIELDSGSEYENVSAVPAAQTEDAEEQEDLV